MNMTEKERHAEFYNADNWVPLIESPTSLIRVMAFNFYSLVIYDLQVFTKVYHWDEGHRPDYREEWQSKFHFVRKGGHIEIVGTTMIWNLMRDAEKEETGK